MQERVPRVQVHPLPVIAVAVKPEPSWALIVTVPVEGRVPELLTVVANVNPVVPWMTELLAVMPVCRSTIGTAIVVGFIAELLPEFVSPPPEIVAVFTTKAGEVAVTSTVTVITG